MEVGKLRPKRTGSPAVHLLQFDSSTLLPHTFAKCTRSGKTKRLMEIYYPHDLTVQQGISGDRKDEAVLETIALTLVLKDFPIQPSLQFELVLG